MCLSISWDCLNARASRMYDTYFTAEAGPVSFSVVKKEQIALTFALGRVCVIVVFVRKQFWSQYSVIHQLSTWKPKEHQIYLEQRNSTCADIQFGSGAFTVVEVTLKNWILSLLLFIRKSASKCRLRGGILFDGSAARDRGRFGGCPYSQSPLLDWNINGDQTNLL